MDLFYMNRGIFSKGSIPSPLWCTFNDEHFILSSILCSICLKSCLDFIEVGLGIISKNSTIDVTCYFNYSYIVPLFLLLVLAFVGNPFPSCILCFSTGVSVASIEGSFHSLFSIILFLVDIPIDSFFFEDPPSVSLLFLLLWGVLFFTKRSFSSLFSMILSFVEGTFCLSINISIFHRISSLDITLLLSSENTSTFLKISFWLFRCGEPKKIFLNPPLKRKWFQVFLFHF